ncbi:VOC family protein [Alkalicella caledoniensis]|uniref:VOC family protein n=1 Tax=Alkalicella caledoniensis TaxID=2731377 RepID=A0A7G9W9R2_ALKCA|nr:VOC family protein [Alkalicella caledoniensis]QNO15424.1 VOC family protein [Alkalicella caledoniensis]
MKINHIALYTNDLEGLKDFYKKYFNGKPNQMYHNENTGLKTYFLTFENDCRLEIMTRPNVKELSRDLISSGFIHLAFSTGSKEGVDSLTKRLEQDGFKILSGPRTTGDGYYESCVLDPDGNQIEIVA